MRNLISVISNNNSIESSLVDKIIECVELIVNKYPITYKNLYTNLENITITSPTLEEEKKLNELGADSSYKADCNRLILNYNILNNKNYKYIILHELLHVATFDGISIGFKSVDSKYGISLNEGITEYLVQEILKEHSVGQAIYKTDINNIMLFSNIISINRIINLYFSNDLNGLFIEYINRIGVNNNLNSLISNMDNDHILKLGREKTNQFKYEYIRLLIDDISKINFINDKEIINTMKVITNFLKCECDMELMSLEIRESIQNSINKMLNKMSVMIGMKL